MKNTTLTQTRQQKSAKTLLDTRILCSSLEFFKGKVTKKQRAIFAVLLHFYVKCPLIFPSHKTIATRAGCSPKTVQRAMEYFEHMGLIAIEKKDRGYLYKVSSWFKSFEVRRRLAVLFPVLALGLPTVIAACNLASNQAIQKNVHLKNNISNVYSNKNRNLYNPVPLPIPIPLVKRESRGGGVNNHTKKRVVMEAEFSKVIDKLPFTPTLYGKIKLSWIPDDILASVSDNLSYPKDIQDPAKYLFAACCSQLKRVERVKDGARYYALGIKYGSFDDATPFTEPGDYSGLGKKRVRVKAKQPTMYSAYETPVVKQMPERTDAELRDKIVEQIMHFSVMPNKSMAFWCWDVYIFKLRQDYTQERVNRIIEQNAIIIPPFLEKTPKSLIKEEAPIVEKSPMTFVGIDTLLKKINL